LWSREEQKKKEEITPSKKRKAKGEEKKRTERERAREPWTEKNKLSHISLSSPCSSLFFHLFASDDGACGVDVDDVVGRVAAAGVPRCRALFFFIVVVAAAAAARTSSSSPSSLFLILYAPSTPPALALLHRFPDAGALSIRRSALRTMVRRKAAPSVRAMRKR